MTMPAMMLVVLALALCGVMALAWFVAGRTGRSGWIDAIWSYAVGAGGVVTSLLPLGSSGGIDARQWLVAGLAALWSLRLGSHIAARTLRGGDDPRYGQLREEWGGKFRQQAVLVPANPGGGSLAAGRLHPDRRASARQPACRIGDLLGIVIFAIALVGEAVADRQLARFSADPKNKGKVCDIGPVGIVTPSELFLRVAGLGRLCRDRHWPRRLLCLGLGSPWRDPSSCTGCSSMSPAFRRSKRTCCARAARLFAPISRASMRSGPACRHPAFRGRSSRRNIMSLISSAIRLVEQRAAAGPHDQSRGPVSGRAAPKRAWRRCRLDASRISCAPWTIIRSPPTPTPPTSSIMSCRRNSSRLRSGRAANIPAASIRTGDETLAEAETACAARNRRTCRSGRRPAHP